MGVIWIDKADEDIVKLEEDILMLQCQLIWDDENWSEQCSNALREKIDHLDMLIEGSKKDNGEKGLQSETEELTPRLHDLLKPLLENYLAHTETTITHMAVPTAVGLSNKKIEENACTIMLKTYERKASPRSLKIGKYAFPNKGSACTQKKDVVIGNYDASGDTCIEDKIKKVISKPSTLEPRRMPNLVHVKLEPADPMVKESSAKTSIRENEEKRNNDNKAISEEAKVVQGRIRHEMKVDSVKARTEASSKAGKASVSYGRATCENVLSVKPSVNTRGRNTKILQTQEAAKNLATEMKNSPCSFNDRTEQGKRPRTESEHQIQVQQKIYARNANKFFKIHSRQSMRIRESRLQKDGVSEREAEKKDGVSEVTAAPILLPREVRKSSLSSQTTSKKERLKYSLMKLARTEHGTSNSIAEEGTDRGHRAKNMPQIPPACIKSKEKLSLTNLRAMAKSRKLRSYYRLRRGELQKVGLEISSVNTI